jgi:molecular chaperone GrpE
MANKQNKGNENLEEKKNSEVQEEKNENLTSNSKEATIANEDEEQKRENSEEKDLKKEAENAEEELLAMEDKYLRLSAEFDNYRKRTLKEKAELLKSAGSDILVDFLPIVDDFERAKASIGETDDIAAIREGVELIYLKFKAFLESKGVKEIETIGEPFDTDKHEAISQIPAGEQEQKGKVVDVVQKGYYINDRVLRFARVVVAN